MPPTLIMTQDDTLTLIDNLFRHEYGNMVATLTRIFGIENLQLAEDVVQETLIKAMQQWSYHGVPDNPRGWLITVAKNRALDVLRRDSTYIEKLHLLEPKLHTESLESTLDFDNTIHDDRLAMLFMGCHPLLSQEMQVTLLLKTVSGFSVSEIARAFLIKESTIAQRLVRAKRKLKEQNIVFSVPDEITFTERLETVLLVIYLIFNEGYKASEGDQLIHKDLCYEAIRLCEMLLAHAQGDVPQSHALMALLLLQASRLDARLDNQTLKLLSEQDRSRWHQGAIQAGLHHLSLAGQGDMISQYHLLAGIATCHALAPTYDDTNWMQILAYYDQLLNLNPSPFVRLNRSVAIAHVQGYEIALAELEQVQGLDDYYLYHTTLADFAFRMNQQTLAFAHYQTALVHTRNQIERQFILSRQAIIHQQND